MQKFKEDAACWLGPEGSGRFPKRLGEIHQSLPKSFWSGETSWMLSSCLQSNCGPSWRCRTMEMNPCIEINAGCIASHWSKRTMDDWIRGWREIRCDMYLGWSRLHLYIRIYPLFFSRKHAQYTYSSLQQITSSLGSWIDRSIVIHSNKLLLEKIPIITEKSSINHIDGPFYIAMLHDRQDWGFARNGLVNVLRRLISLRRHSVLSPWYICAFVCPKTHF